jgi:hypothetical protein
VLLAKNAGKIVNIGESGPRDADENVATLSIFHRLVFLLHAVPNVSVVEFLMQAALRTTQPHRGACGFFVP